MKLSPDRIARQQADNAAAVARNHLRYARLDAAGLCRTCGIVARAEGRKRCADCLARQATARNARSERRIRIEPLPWCGECLAAGFHRADCEVRL